MSLPSEAEFFSWLQLRGRLRLEMAGLRFRPHSAGGTTTLQCVNNLFGTNFKRRADALVFVEGKIFDALREKNAKEDDRCQ